MARTPIFSKLVEAVRLAAESEARGVPVDAVLQRRAGGAVGRREFMKRAAATGALAAGALSAPRAAFGQSVPRVAVVGAGLAGLTAAYRLGQAGVVAEVFEGNTRLGGRCWTLRGAFAEGQIVERGGELIDQGHGAIRQLCQELRLETDNLLAAEPQGTEPLYFFDGQPYTYGQATADVKAIWQKIHRDVVEASYPTTYYQSTPRGRELDRMSILDWIVESVPGGTAAPLGQLLDVAYAIEYGAETRDQSALNLLYLLGYSGQGQFRVFGPSNEKYRVRGGNDQIVPRLAAALPGPIATGAPLAAIALTSDGRYALTFGRAVGRTSTKVFDHVVLALPFSILRSQVDFRRAGFDGLKTTAILEQGMGANTKLQLQFRTRHWAGLGVNGDTFSDTGYQNTWEVTRAQPGLAGILNDYTGGDVARGFERGTRDDLARRFLAQVEPVLPGLSAQWNGRASLDVWSANPWTRGAYSYWRVGQYTRFAGVEGERSGNCHFCGEHTSLDFQGYLNGAVETGERAAAEVAADLRAASAAR